MQELIQEQRPQQEEVLSLDFSLQELEETLVAMGAQIVHPVKMDPVALINGKAVAFWVT